MKKTLITVAISALLSGGAAAGPKAPLPKDLLPYAPDKPLPVPQIEKKTLANGLEVWVVPREGLPRVDYVLAIRKQQSIVVVGDTKAIAEQLKPYGEFATP